MATVPTLYLTILLMILRMYGLQSCQDLVIEDCQCTKGLFGALSVKCSFQTPNPSQKLGNFSTDIDHLNLSSSSLTRLPVEFLAGVDSVRSIDMSHNLFDEIPLFMSGVRHFDTVDLSHNIIPTIVPRSIRIGVLFRMKSLNLDYNRISDVGDLKMDYFPELFELLLSHNALRSLELHIYFPILTVLNLSGNKISKVTSIDLGVGSRLQTLHLNSNRIRYISPDALVSLKDLKVIDLSQNMIEWKDSSSLPFPEHVLSINMNGCNLTHLDECHLLQLRDLKYLNIENNDVVCSCELLWLYEHVQMNVNNKEYTNINKLQSVGFHGKCYAEEYAQQVDVPNFNNNCSGDDYRNFFMSCHPQRLRQKFRRLDSYVDTLQLNVSLELDTLVVEWTKSNSYLVYGFMVHVHHIENEIAYDSSILHPSVSIFRNTHHDVCCGTYVVCLHVLLNQTYIYHKTCGKAEQENVKFVIGILVGILFLIPCVLAIVCVLVKDKRNRKYVRLQSMRDGCACKGTKQTAPQIRYNRTPICDIIRNEHERLHKDRTTLTQYEHGRLYTAPYNGLHAKYLVKEDGECSGLSIKYIDEDNSTNPGNIGCTNEAFTV